MSLEIDAALRDGFERTISRNGLVLIGVFLAFSFANIVLSQSLLRALEPVVLDQLSGLSDRATSQFRSGFNEPRPFALPIPLPIAGLLTLVAALIGEALRIASIRVFAAEQQPTFPTTTALNRIVAATINGIVAGILVFIAIAIGFVFLFVPALYIGISLYFVRQEIAVEDKNFIDAIRDSWALTGGNRWELLGLGVILFVIGFIASSPGIVLGFLSPALSTVVSTIIGSATAVFGIAVTTRAYHQLRYGRPQYGGPGPESGGYGDHGHGGPGQGRGGQGGQGGRGQGGRGGRGQGGRGQGGQGGRGQGGQGGRGQGGQGRGGQGQGGRGQGGHGGQGGQGRGGQGGRDDRGRDDGSRDQR